MWRCAKQVLNITFSLSSSSQMTPVGEMWGFFFPPPNFIFIPDTKNDLWRVTGFKLTLLILFTGPGMSLKGGKPKSIHNNYRYLPLISVGLGKRLLKVRWKKGKSECVGRLNEEDQIPGLI